MCLCLCVRACACVCASFKMWSVELGELNQYGGSEVKSLSRVRLFATPWIGLDSEGEGEGEGGMIWENGIDQAPPSTEFSRQEYWSGLPFPSPEDLPNPGIEPTSPTL